MMASGNARHLGPNDSPGLHYCSHSSNLSRGYDRNNVLLKVVSAQVQFTPSADILYMLN